MPLDTQVYKLVYAIEL